MGRCCQGRCSPGRECKTPSTVVAAAELFVGGVCTFPQRRLSLLRPLSAQSMLLGNVDASVSKKPDRSQASSMMSFHPLRRLADHAKDAAQTDHNRCGRTTPVWHRRLQTTLRRRCSWHRLRRERRLLLQSLPACLHGQAARRMRDSRTGLFSVLRFLQAR